MLNLGSDSAGRYGDRDLTEWLQSGLAQAVAWVAVLGLGAWIALHWLSIITAPQRNDAPAGDATPDIQAAAVQAANAPLFGQGRAGGADGAAATAGDIKLRGVFAGTGSVQAAIVNFGKDDSFVALNGEIFPGVVLQEVHPTHIVVSRHGVMERVELDAMKSAEGGGAAARRRSERAPESVAPPARDEAAEAPGSPGVPSPEADVNAPVPQAAPMPGFAPGPNAVPAPPVPSPQSRRPDVEAKRFG